MKSESIKLWKIFKNVKSKLIKLWKSYIFFLQLVENILISKYLYLKSHNLYNLVYREIKG